MAQKAQPGVDVGPEPLSDADRAQPDGEPEALLDDEREALSDKNLEVLLDRDQEALLDVDLRVRPSVELEAQWNANPKVLLDVGLRALQGIKTGEINLLINADLGAV